MAHPDRDRTDRDITLEEILPFVTPPFGAERIARLSVWLMRENGLKTKEEAGRFIDSMPKPRIRRFWNEMLSKNPEEKAQEIAFQAREAVDDDTARRLATEALAIDPDCVDALNVIAVTTAKTPEEKIAKTREVVGIAERLLGPTLFEKAKGQFWGLPSTRPYVRARNGLADLLKDAGRIEEAIGHWEALLGLCSEDDLVIRWGLLACYLIRADLGGLQALFEKFDDGSEVMAWGRVLERYLWFDEEGARAALKKAREEYPLVEDFLTGRKTVPEGWEPSPGLTGPWQEIRGFRVLEGPWKAHSGAVEWLRKQEGK